MAAPAALRTQGEERTAGAIREGKKEKEGNQERERERNKPRKLFSDLGVGRRPFSVQTTFKTLATVTSWFPSITSTSLPAGSRVDFDDTPSLTTTGGSTVPREDVAKAELCLFYLTASGLYFGTLRATADINRNVII